jgi:hypothetical protein
MLGGGKQMKNPPACWGSPTLAVPTMLRKVHPARMMEDGGSLLGQHQGPVAAVPQPRGLSSRQTDPPRLRQEKVLVVAW